MRTPGGDVRRGDVGGREYGRVMSQRASASWSDANADPALRDPTAPQPARQRSRDRHPGTAVDPFVAMAEPARRRIVEILASGEHTAGELAAAVGAEFSISRTAVSKHLRVLRDARFIDVRGELQWRWYYLTDSGIDLLEAAVARLRAQYEGGVGWDSGQRRKRDPLRGIPEYGVPVGRKGPGRAYRRGRRGRQSTAPIASEPDRGLYHAVAPPP